MAALWNPKAKSWTTGRSGLFEKISSVFAGNSSGVIWMHCSSLGEFEQGRPVLEALKREYPGYKTLVSFFSPSGYEVRKEYEGADLVCYLPMDGSANAQRFLDLVQPSLVLWVKYEYWHYFITEIHKRKIPLLLVSAIYFRQMAFFHWYGAFYRKMLEYFTHIFVQDPISAGLLEEIGVKTPYTISGDTRFDRVHEIASQWQPLDEVERFCGKHPVLIAGSTWPGDEELLTHYSKTHPNLRLIIAPHDIQEDRLLQVEALFKDCIRYSIWKNQLSTHEREVHHVLLIDNVGLLSRLYKYATITYVGGGFGEDGVHNMLEPAVFFKPVIIGPEYEKYVEAVALVNKGAAFSIESAIELEAITDKLLGDQEYYQQCSKLAGEYVAQSKGATSAICDYVQRNRLLTR
jgi:3-deoxy-D-manno-octulosonic-acid transferase